MKIVFVADGHLKGPADPAQKSLVSFLESLKDIDTLVVLGDLFEFWTGANKTAHQNYLVVLEALKRLKTRNTKIVYLEGNHDFSMGSFFTDTLGAEVHPDTHIMDIEGKRYLLLHGDTVEMTAGHALWRGFLRSPAFKLLAAVLPSGAVWNIAMRLSKKSRAYNNKGNIVGERLKAFAKKEMASGLNGVITGHSHSACVESAGGGIYANPGSWAGERSYLVYEKGAFRVERWRG